MLLNASTDHDSRGISYLLAAKLADLADTFPQKHALNVRLTFASQMVRNGIRKKYKQFSKFPQAAKDKIMKEAIDSAIRFRRGQQDPKSYTRANLSTSDEAGVRNDLEQSQFSMSDCVSRKTPQLGEIEAARECSEELGGPASFRTTALKGETFHQDTNTGSVISQSSKGPSFSPKEPTLPNSPNTPLYFGMKGKETSLQKAKRALIQATLIEESMRSDKAFRTLSAAIRSTNKHPTVDQQLHPTVGDVVGYSLPGDHNDHTKTFRDTLVETIQNQSSSSIKNASNNKRLSPAFLAAIHRHELFFNSNYAAQVEIERQKAENNQRIKQASVNSSVPAWIRAREHLPKVAGLG